MLNSENAGRGAMKMQQKKTVQAVDEPDKIISYFKKEVFVLAIITVSGIIYNIGMTAGPYFEGQLAQRLFDIINGEKTFQDMVSLALLYVAVIFIVQFMRYIKRFYVRRFGNDTNRTMRHMLYNSLVHKSKAELSEESVGTLMTKAVSDVDACVEGMRKFTTEIFDTGIVLVAYLAMLLSYDWKLTILSCIFIPFAYVIAEKLKKVVVRYNFQFKESVARLNDATLDRVGNAMTYRMFGQEEERNHAYESQLKDYEKKAVKANIWENTMQPIYNIVSMTGVIFIIYFGAKNIAGNGFTSWNIAAFTTFLSCFSKLALKSSRAAKLFNAVQKAEVSWKRIKPLMEPYKEEQKEEGSPVTKGVKVRNLSFSYPGGPMIVHDLSFEAKPGQMIGVTGAVASGKSTLGKVFLCEYPYGGSITIDEKELSTLSTSARSKLISYMGHAPELMSDSVKENICLGSTGDITGILRTVCLVDEVNQMKQKEETYIGNNGVRLSGGQQARLALARTLYQEGEILILDDPFSAVDKETERQIMDNIRTEYKDKIVVLISHRLSHFSEFDQIIWMDGEKEEVGSHATLMKENEAYARLYKAQTEGGAVHEA